LPALDQRGEPGVERLRRRRAVLRAGGELGEDALARLRLPFEQAAVVADVGVVGELAGEFVRGGLDGGERGGEFVRRQRGLGAERNDAFVAQLLFAQGGQFLVARAIRRACG